MSLLQKSNCTSNRKHVWKCGQVCIKKTSRRNTNIKCLILCKKHFCKCAYVEQLTNQHVAIFNVKVQEEEEGDEEAEEGNSGAFPQTSHLVQGFPHQPHALHSIAEICTK